ECRLGRHRQAGYGPIMKLHGDDMDAPSFRHAPFGPSSRRFRLQTLVWLRWVAVAGQTLTVLIVDLLLAFPLPLLQAAFLIGALAVANIMLSLWFPSTQRLGPKAALSLLSFDLLQMACLLFITGGLANPFAPLICVPVIISFASQPLKHSIALIVFALICTIALAFSP